MIVERTTTNECDVIENMAGSDEEKEEVIITEGINDCLHDFHFGIVARIIRQLPHLLFTFRLQFVVEDGDYECSLDGHLVGLCWTRIGWDGRRLSLLYDTQLLYIPFETRKHFTASTHVEIGQMEDGNDVLVFSGLDDDTHDLQDDGSYL